MSSGLTDLKGRSLYLDVLKGWAIMLVVIGHAVQRSEALGAWPWHASGAQIVPNVLSTGSMPLFIGISGFLTFGRVRRPIGTWLTSKARLLLVPWASWTLIYYLIVRDPLMRTDMSLPAYVQDQVLSPSLWYLIVLFFCYVVLALGLEVGEWSLPLLGVMIVLVPLFFPVLSNSYLIFRMEWYFWWFICGYFLARFQSRVFKARWLAWAMAVPVLVAGLATLESDNQLWSAFLIGLSIALTSTFVAWAMTRSPLSRPVAYVGVHSLEIYVGHFLFLGLLIVHSPENALLTALIAIVGSLGLGRLLRSNRFTNAVLLGGRKLPRRTI